MRSRSPGAGTGCLFLFLLPFAGIGLYAGYEAFRLAATGDRGQAAFMALFALVFGGVGLGGMAAARVGGRKLAERAALEARHPDAPWLWRSDWAAGRIEDGSRATMWATWVFAGFWNLVSLPGAWLGVRAAVYDGEKAALLALLFPLVGAGLLAWAVGATLRYRRYGVSVLELHTVPGTVGRSLEGVVRTTALLRPADGFRTRLTSVRRVTRGTGKRRRTSEAVLWEEERRVPGEPVRTAQGMTTAIAVGFGLPRDVAPSADGDPRDAVVWRLRVDASVPGVDYEAGFEVPVFRTPASDSPIGAEPEPAVRPAAVPPDYRQPPQSRVQVTTNRRGTEILFPAARNAAAAAGATLFLAIWAGAVALMLGLGAPVFIVAIFGLIGVLVLWGVLELWLRVTRVTADAGTVIVASGYLFPGRERRIPMSEIAEVRTRIGMQAGGTPYYDLVLTRTGGGSLVAGHGIRDKREAEWLAGLLRGTLGLETKDPG